MLAKEISIKTMILPPMNPEPPRYDPKLKPSSTCAVWAPPIQALEKVNKSRMQREKTSHLLLLIAEIAKKLSSAIVKLKLMQLISIRYV